MITRACFVTFRYTLRLLLAQDSLIDTVAVGMTRRGEECGGSGATVFPLLIDEHFASPVEVDEYRRTLAIDAFKCSGATTTTTTSTTTTLTTTSVTTTTVTTTTTDTDTTTTTVTTTTTTDPTYERVASLDGKKCQYSPTGKRAPCANGKAGSCGVMSVALCAVQCKASPGGTCNYFSHAEGAGCILCKDVPADGPWDSALTYKVVATTTAPATTTTAPATTTTAPATTTPTAEPDCACAAKPRRWKRPLPAP